MALAANFGQRNLVNDAADLRFVRNHAEYRAEAVTLDDASDALAIGEELVKALADPIASLLDAAN